MRTTIVIDDGLLKAAHDATGLKTNEATIEAGLRLLVRPGWPAQSLNPLWEAVDTEGGIMLMRKDRPRSG